MLKFRLKPQYNTMLTGTLVGVLFPAAVFYLIYYVKYGSSSKFFEFLKVAADNDAISPMISLSIIINLALFFLFLNTDAANVSRGIIISTLIYGVLIFFFKFFY